MDALEAGDPGVQTLPKNALKIALSMFSSVVPGVLDSVEWLAILEFYLLLLITSDIDLRSPKSFVQAR